jgi:hypothetical protein
MERFSGEEETEGAFGRLPLSATMDHGLRSLRSKKKKQGPVRRLAMRAWRQIKAVFRGREFSDYQAVHFGRDE